MNDNIRGVGLILMFVLAILLVIVGIGVGVSAWMQANYGADSVLAFWAMVFVIVGIVAGWGMSLRTQRATLNAIVDFQAADDRGEVARAKVLQEVMRGSWRGDAFAANQQAKLSAPQQEYPALTVDWSKAALPVVEGEWADL